MWRTQSGHNDCPNPAYDSIQCCVRTIVALSASPAQQSHTANHCMPCHSSPDNLSTALSRNLRQSYEKKAALLCQEQSNHRLTSTMAPITMATTEANTERLVVSHGFRS